MLEIQKVLPEFPARGSGTEARPLSVEGALDAIVNVAWQSAYL